MHLPQLHKRNRLTLELRKVSITNGDDKAALKKKGPSHWSTHCKELDKHNILWDIEQNTCFMSSLPLPDCTTLHDKVVVCLPWNKIVCNAWVNSDLKTDILKIAHIKWYSPTLWVFHKPWKIPKNVDKLLHSLFREINLVPKYHFSSFAVANLKYVFQSALRFMNLISTASIS